LLRDRFFYFTPEYEYYWPPYEKDPSKRVIRWPVKVKKEKNPFIADVVLWFELGREYDDERSIGVGINENEDGTKEIVTIYLDHCKYIPTEPVAKNEVLVLWIYTDKGEAELFRRYYNEDGSEYQVSDEPIMVFQKGNSEPVVDNTSGEPELELSGVECLFDLKYEDAKSWEVSLFQTYRALINLCKLQLDLEENGYELERVLREDFLYFAPWKPLCGSWDCWDPETEPAEELVNVKRIGPVSDPDEIQVFEFKMGHFDFRILRITFLKELGRPDKGFEWGLEKIVLIRPLEMEDGSLAEEHRVFKFGHVRGTPVNWEEMFADYERYLYNSNGELITPEEEIPQLTFVRGNPQPLVYPAYALIAGK
jgi:hypothetical protein